MIQLRSRRRFTNVLTFVTFVVQLTIFATAKLATKGQLYHHRASDAYSFKSRSNQEVKLTKTAGSEKNRNRRKQQRRRRLKSHLTMDTNIHYNQQNWQHQHKHLPVGDDSSKSSTIRDLKKKHSKKNKKYGPDHHEDKFVNPDLCIVRDSVIVQDRAPDYIRSRQLFDVSFTTNNAQLQLQQQRITTTVDKYNNAELILPVDSDDESNQVQQSNYVRAVQETTYGPPPEWIMPYPYCDEVIISPTIPAPVPVPVPFPEQVPPPMAGGVIPVADIIPPPVPTITVPPPIAVDIPTTPTGDVPLPLPNVLSPTGETPTADIPPPLPTPTVPNATPVEQPSSDGSPETPVQFVPSAPTSDIASPTNDAGGDIPFVPTQPPNDDNFVLPFTPTLSPTIDSDGSDGGGSIPFIPTLSPTPTSSGVPDSFIDCDGIASGTAAVNGYYYEEFLITMTVNSDNDISTATTDLQQHLQKYVATSMAGCRDLQDSPIPPPAVLQESNATLRNVVFYVNNNTQKFSTKQGKIFNSNMVSLPVNRKLTLCSYVSYP
jgi:hypothetical protein